MKIRIICYIGTTIGPHQEEGPGDQNCRVLETAKGKTWTICGQVLSFGIGNN